MNKLIYTDKQITKSVVGDVAFINTDDYGKFIVQSNACGVALCVIEQIFQGEHTVIFQSYNHSLDDLIKMVDNYEYMLLGPYLSKLFGDYIYHERRSWRYSDMDYTYTRHDDNLAELQMFYSTLM